MSSTKWGEIIRTQKGVFCTPNIYGVNENETVSVSLDNFRTAKNETEYFLFLKWQGNFYYPLWLEFRSINNNLLYLTDELQIKSFNTIRAILQSSMAKEEKWVNEMQALIYHVKQEPQFCHLLDGFTIEPDHSREAHER
jgi:hypothetical protein